MMELARNSTDLARVAAPTPTLHVHRTGAGVPLVLLHGLGESHVGWLPVIGTLAAEYDVLAVDLPGFGQSAPLPAGVPPTADNIARAVEVTLEQLGIVDFHVAGYSLGARVAIAMASSDRVQSLVAIGPDGLGTPLERIQGYVATVAGRGVATALAPFARQLSLTPMGRSMFFAGSRSLPWQLEPDEAERLLTDYADSPAYGSTNWAALFDVPTNLQAITAPALFLQGTADPLMSQQIGRYVACLPGARLRWLPGLNHVPISDAPSAVATAMLEFLHQSSAASLDR